MKGFFISFVYMCCLLVGCTGSPQSPQTEARLYLQSEPLPLDPRIGFDRRTQQVLRELFEGLTRIGPNGEPQLALAKSLHISKDGTVYTFRIHPSLWSNGTEVTAEDFVFAWKSSLDPKKSNSRSEALFIIANAKKARSGECSLDEVGVRAVEKNLLEVTLEHPTPYFLELLANPVFSPLCRSVVEKDPHFSEKIPFVSNGPYILAQHDPHSHIILEKNPLYSNPDRPHFGRLSFSIIEDPQTAYNMFLAGVLDWYGEPFGSICPEMVANLYQNGTLTSHLASASHQLFCKTTAPHLRSINIRKAIASAINRTAIYHDVLQGGKTPAFSLSPQTLSYLTTPPFGDHNPKLARKLFSQGLAELGFTEQTYPPIIISFWADPAIKSMVEAIQSQLIEVLGIDVILKPLDWDSYLKNVYSGDYEIMDLALNCWTFDPSSNLDIFKYAKTPLNGTGWSNPEYTRLLDLAEMSQDPHERHDYFQKAEICIMDQLPVVPICYQTFKYVKSPKIRGEAVSPVGVVELKWLQPS